VGRPELAGRDSGDAEYVPWHFRKNQAILRDMEQGVEMKTFHGTLQSGLFHEYLKDSIKKQTKLRFSYT